jgi:hypothetical protein
MLILSPSRNVAVPPGRLFRLTTFVVVQRDDNAIPIAADEFKGIIIVGGDFVHVMSHGGKHVDRFVVSSPVHGHIFVVVLLTEHALACLL